MINYLVPNFQIIEQANAVKTALAGKGIADADMVGFIVGNFYKNARVFTAKNLDFWLGFGGYLPAVEWVMAKAKGETEDEFYARTQGTDFAVQSVDDAGDRCREEDFPCRVWLRQHYDELPVNEWVAVNLDGLVDHDPDLLKLVDKVIAHGLRGVELTYTFTAPTGLKITWSIAAP